MKLNKEFAMIEKTDMKNDYQCLLQFGEEYELSIISGRTAYGHGATPYEIAVFKGSAFVQLPGITGDYEVTGHLSEENVNTIITKLYAMTGQLPVQL